MTKKLEMVVEELESAEMYKEMAAQTEDYDCKAMLTEMAQDEEKHAKYILKMHPELQELIERIKAIPSNPY